MNYLCLTLVFHPSVLEPHFNLAFSQIKGRSYLYTSRSTQIFIKVELFFQLKKLSVCVSRPESPGASSSAGISITTDVLIVVVVGRSRREIWKTEKQNIYSHARYINTVFKCMCLFRKKYSVNVSDVVMIFA